MKDIIRNLISLLQIILVTVYTPHAFQILNFSGIAPSQFKIARVAKIDELDRPLSSNEIVIVVLIQSAKMRDAVIPSSELNGATFPKIRADESQGMRTIIYQRMIAGLCRNGRRVGNFSDWIGKRMNLLASFHCIERAGFERGGCILICVERGSHVVNHKVIAGITYFRNGTGKGFLQMRGKLGSY